MRYQPVIMWTTIPSPTRNVLVNVRNAQNVISLNPGDGFQHAFLEYIHSVVDTDPGSSLLNAEVYIHGALTLGALYADFMRAVEITPIDQLNGEKLWMPFVETGGLPMSASIENFLLIDEQDLSNSIIHYTNGYQQGVRNENLSEILVRMMNAGCMYIGQYSTAGVNLAVPVGL